VDVVAVISMPHKAKIAMGTIYHIPRRAPMAGYRHNVAHQHAARRCLFNALTTSNFNSRAMIDACCPFDWRDKFPHVVE